MLIERSDVAGADQLTAAEARHLISRNT